MRFRTYFLLYLCCLFCLFTNASSDAGKDETKESRTVAKNADALDKKRTNKNEEKKDLETIENNSKERETAIPSASLKRRKLQFKEEDDATNEKPQRKQEEKEETDEKGKLEKNDYDEDDDDDEIVENLANKKQRNAPPPSFSPPPFPTFLPSFSSSRSVSPPRLMRLPYRTSSDETLRFPDSVGVGVEGEPSLEEVEENSKEIANAVNVQIKKVKKGRIMIALTELTHPVANENSQASYLDVPYNKEYDDYDIENDENIGYSNEEEQTYGNEANEKLSQRKEQERTSSRENRKEEAGHADSYSTGHRRSGADEKERRKAAERKRLQELREHVHNDLNIDILKEQGIVEDARLLDSIGLLVLDFNKDADEEKIRDTVKQLWHVHRGIWMIEADTPIALRGVDDDFNNNNNDNVEGVYNYKDTPSTLEDDIYIEESEANAIGDDNDGNMSNSDYDYGLSTLKKEILKLQKLIKESEEKEKKEKEKQKEEAGKNKEKEEEEGDESMRDVDEEEKERQRIAKEKEDLEWPNDPYVDRQWGIYNPNKRIDIRALEAFKLTKNMTKNEVIIAHIDTGVDMRHPDLQGKIWENLDEIPFNGIDDDGNGYIDDRYGWNFEGKDNNVLDMHGHGTHTAGIIAAITNNKNGVAGMVSNAKLMVLKFRSLASDAVEAIEYSMKKNAFISTNSWGFNMPIEALRLAIEKTKLAGQLFICAVDNRGKDNTWYSDYPPNWQLSNMIRVASMTSYGELDSTSNYGRTNVDLAAPGRRVISTVPKEVYHGKSYAYKDGTSMATPFVSGVAALLKSIRSDLTAYQIREAIMESVTPMSSLANKVVSNGMLNAENAVKHVLGIEYKKTELKLNKQFNDNRHGNFLLPYAYDLTSFFNRLRFNWFADEEADENSNSKNDSQNWDDYSDSKSMNDAYSTLATYVHDKPQKQM